MYKSRTERLQAQRRKRLQRWKMVMMRTIPIFLLSAMACCIFLAISQFRRDLAETPAQQPEAVTNQSPVSEPEPRIRLTFAGDVMMSGNVEKILLEKGYDYPYTQVKAIFAEDDFTVVNLETPVTFGGTPHAGKEYVYKSSPDALPAMKAAGIDAVNLANNHSMDQGADGLLDTFNALDANEIAYVGAGIDIERAYAPVYVERNGIRLALLGFSRVVPEVSWYAGKNKPGIAASYDPALAVQAIREARSNADLVVVIAHWGEERQDFANDSQKELARAYVEAGADLIVGSHPHVVQGLENIEGKWVAYSLGNFVFTRSLSPKTWESMVLEASCSKSGDCDLRVLPIYTELARPVLMQESEAAALLKRIESISFDVRILPDGTVQKASSPSAEKGEGLSPAREP